MPSRQVSSVTPKWSSISSERRKPGVNDDRRDPVRRHLVVQHLAEPDERHLDDVVEHRPAVPGVERSSPSVISTTSAGPAPHQQRQHRVRVIRWVSRPLRSARAPCPGRAPTAACPTRSTGRHPTCRRPGCPTGRLLGLDARHQRRHVGGHHVVAAHGDPAPPALVTRSAVSSMVSARPTTLRCSRVVRPVTYTVAPAAPSSTAIPRPAPRVAPVTRAILSVRLMSAFPS